MSATLQKVQGELDSKNVRDVKFLFKREAVALPISDLEEDVAAVLTMFHAGKKTVVAALPSEALSN